MFSKKRLRTVAIVTAALFTTASPSWAAGTLAGTQVDNTASVSYSVGGTPQTPISSNTVSFVVDMRVNLTCSELGGAATSSPMGATDQVLTFTVQNTSNATLDFRLGASQTLLGGTVLGLLDAFDLANVRVYADVNNNGVYDPATDTLDYLDELAPDALGAVFVVVDVPSNAVGGGVTEGAAGIQLTARAAAGGTASVLGADLVPTIGVDDPATVEIVFADSSGLLDIIHDGACSAADVLDLILSDLAFAKYMLVVSDPVNGVVLPKAIPGATLEYCLAAMNNGASTVTNLSVTDAIPTGTTYVAGSIISGGTLLAGVCTLGTAEDDNAAGADETDPAGASFSANAVHATFPNLATLASYTVRFRVTVD